MGESSELNDYPHGAPCFRHMQTTSALMLKLEQQGEKIIDTEYRLTRVEEASRSVELALATMTGAIPKIESSLSQITNSFRELELKMTVLFTVKEEFKKIEIGFEDHRARIAAAERLTAVNSSRQRLIWAIVAMIFAGMVALASRLIKS